MQPDEQVTTGMPAPTVFVTAPPMRGTMLRFQVQGSFPDSMHNRNTPSNPEPESSWYCYTHHHQHQQDHP